MSVRVYLQKAVSRIKIPTKKQFQQWTDAALHALPYSLSSDLKEIGIRLVDKDESAQLNITYRGKKGPTNVLSFAYPPVPNLPQESLGDLVLCAPLVNEEAEAQQKSQEAHWAHLTIHGILHLLGYDHVKKKQAAVMEKLEIKILKQLGFSNPY